MSEGAFAVPGLGADVATAAARYLELGWSLIPMEPGANLPVVIRAADGRPETWRHKPEDPACADCPKPDFDGHVRRFRWKPYQTVRATPVDVEQWRARWPEMNLGLVCGAVSGIVGVDIDERKQGRANLEAAAARIPLRVPATLLSRTPGGFHALYRQPPGVTTRNGVDFAGALPGVDVRGDGGVLTLPPSRRPDGLYRWVRAVPPADAPDWVLRPEVVSGPARAARQADGVLASPDHPHWVGELLTRGEQQGRRNESATRLAGYLLKQALPQDIVVAVMLAFGERCEPPMDRHELGATVRSVAAAESRAKLAGVAEPTPTEIDLGSGWRYEFPDHPVQVAFRDVERHGDGIGAELTVTHTLRGRDEPRFLLGPVHFNLLAASTQASHAKILRQRYDIEWLEKLQTASRLCIAAWRAGEPATLLGVEPVEPEVLFALRPLLLADGPSMLFADSGVGKSLVALAAAMSIGLGEAIGLGLSPLIHRKVGYLDTEWTLRDHDRRVFQLVGRRPGGVNVLYKSLNVPLWDAAGALAEWVRDEGIGYLVIDSVALACGGRPEEAEAVNRFFSALRRIGVGGSTGMGALLLAHITNQMAREHEPDRPFGSAYWRANSRLMWFMTKVAEEGSDALDVALICKKVNAGPLYPTLSYHINFDTRSGIALHRQDVRATPALADHAPLLARVEYHLRRGPLAIARLVERLREEAQAREEGAHGPGAETVRTACERGVERRRLVRVESGEQGGITRYALAAPAGAYEAAGET